MKQGIDVAVYQGAQGVDWYRQFDFVIVQIFTEHGSSNPDWPQQVAEARQAGCVVSAYGWAIAGADNRALGAQLVQAVPGCPIYWDDHEIGGRSRMPSAQDVADYVAGIESAGGVGGYYSNLSDYVGLSCPWWFANPSNNRAPRTPLVVQNGYIDGEDSDVIDDSLWPQFTHGAPNDPGGCVGVIVTNTKNGQVWLLAPGFSKQVPYPPADQTNRLYIYGARNAGFQDPLHIVQMCEDMGAPLPPSS